LDHLSVEEVTGWQTSAQKPIAHFAYRACTGSDLTQAKVTTYMIAVKDPEYLVMVGLQTINAEQILAIYPIHRI
jgi:hypothetical protein